MLVRYLFIFALCLPLVSAYAQDENPGLVRTDTLGDKNKKLRWIGIPVAFYTPETNFGFGGGGQVFLTSEENRFRTRVSNILFSGMYTLNEQILLDFQPQIYFGGGRYYLDSSYKFEIYPNRFWGIGNTTPDSNEERYNMTSHQLRIDFLKLLPPNLNFGLRFVFENHDITEVEEGGLLDQGDIPGSDRAVIVGLGAVFNLDTRDFVEDPRSGYFINFNAEFSSENFGATHGFNRFVTDIRGYFPINDVSLVAGRIHFVNNFGDVPFQAKAWYGGGSVARGYFAGRFIDDQMYVLTAEYRWRFSPRWGMAAFALVGEVGNINQDFFNDVKPAVGGGVRWQVLKAQNTLLRLDIGVGKNGNSGFYFGVNQAF